MKRKPTKYEINLLNKLLSLEFRGVNELREQAKDILVEVDDHGDNCGSFAIFTNRKLPKAKVRDRIPVEGHYRHKDEYIEYLLHVVGGYLDEVEIVLYNSHDKPLEKPILIDKITFQTHEQSLKETYIGDKRPNFRKAEKQLEKMLQDIRDGGYASADKLRQGETITKELAYDNGEEYQITVQALYDDKTKKHIRVMADICDHTPDEKEIKLKWWQFWKLTHTSSFADDFIIAPDGKLIDES